MGMNQKRPVVFWVVIMLAGMSLGATSRLPAQIRNKNQTS